MTAYIDRMKNRPATVKGTLFRPVGLGEVLHQRCDVLFRNRCTAAADHAFDDFFPFILRRLAGADQVQTMAAAAAGVEKLLHCFLIVPRAEVRDQIRQKNVMRPWLYRNSSFCRGLMSTRL